MKEALHQHRPRLGFLGLGWIGRQRMESIAAADIADIVAVCDPAAELAAEAAAAVPGALVVPTFDDLLGQELDGVVIASPSALHAEQSILALGHGHAVFCQKPLGRSAEETALIIDAARRADRLLGVDLSYRHVEGMREIRALLQRGELGRVFAADLVFHNAYGPGKPWFYSKPLSGGGCVIDLGIHLVDAAIWALEAEVIEVSGKVLAKGQPLDPADEHTVEDYASARLVLDTGAVVNLACSWNLHAGRPAVISAAFYGTDGGVVLRNLNGSFTEFETVRLAGTSEQRIAGPPDEWGGRAAVAWARQLASSCRFDPEISRQLHVAAVLDGIYGRSDPKPAFSTL